MPKSKQSGKNIVAAGGMNAKAVPTGGGNIKTKTPAKNILSNANAALKQTSKKPKKLVGNDGAS